jgi:hypothetical protein
MKKEIGIMPTLDAATSELGRRANQGVVCNVANQMKGETGIMQTLEMAASENGRRSFEGRRDKIVMAGIAPKDTFFRRKEGK